MAKKKNLSPYGCQDCVKRYTGDDGAIRCRDTGHKTRFFVNARWHCRGFDLDKKEDSATAVSCSFCVEPSKGPE